MRLNKLRMGYGLQLLVMLLLAIPVLANAAGAPTISRLSTVGSNFAAGSPVNFTVIGSGRCDARIEYGDGFGDSLPGASFASPLSLKHTYSKAGTFNAVIKGAKGGASEPCTGQAQATIQVAPPAGAAATQAQPNLEVFHAIGTYADSTKLKASLKKGADAVPDVEISFWVAGEFIAKAKTGQDGIAQVEYWITEGLKPGAEIKAVGAGLTARNNIGLVKRLTKLTLTVDYPGSDVVATEGKEVTLKGKLLYSGKNIGPKARKVRVMVDGKEYKSDYTDQYGAFKIGFAVPRIAVGGDTHVVKALFDDDKDCCYIVTASDEQKIKVKEGPHKLPPTISHGSAIRATGFN